MAPGANAGDAVEAARSVVALHASDPATVYLAARARVEDLAIADLDDALYIKRSLVKHLAMRRTLFVFPRESLDDAQAGASERVAASERRRLVRDVEKAGLWPDGEKWLDEASRQVIDALSGGREATSSELRDEIPLLGGAITYGEGRRWGAQVPVAPRVLTTLSAAGRVVRSSNDGPWTASRPRWSTMEAWLGEELSPPAEPEGLAKLVERWLRAFGPGTARDIKWWLGSTLSAVRQALTEIAAVEVDLDGETGFVLPDDVDETEPVEPWAALLPSLDSTAMGWAQRDWYLGPHGPHVFDANGNAGATAWWEGRIVGAWRQSEAGEVEPLLVEDVGGDGLRALEEEAGRLTEWLGGTRVKPRFPSPLEKRGHV